MNYEKITKTQARKMHAEGKAVYATASKVNPYSKWISPYEIPKEMDFEKFCNEYCFYNCNSETGKKITFYKEESRFEPRQRTAINGKVWWVVYDRYKQEFSSLTCFGQYKKKKDCQWAIDYYKEVM